MVAVKVLFPELSQDNKNQAARFRNEIFAAYGVNHPNVVKAWEYIRDGDLIAYSMEFVSGGDLATKLGRADAPMDIPSIVKLLSQMCAGVQAIHDAGIVHRDLKPENILLTKEGDVKIADFGIARLELASSRKLTEHGGVVGTIDYVAPEYLLSSQIDARADIYAVGILGYEMITGESPFRGETIYDTMWKRIKSDPPPPSHVRSECPIKLDEIILRAMARAPEDRFQTARDMLEQLRLLSIESGSRPSEGGSSPIIEAIAPRRSRDDMRRLRGSGEVSLKPRGQDDDNESFNISQRSRSESRDPLSSWETGMRIMRSRSERDKVGDDRSFRPHEGVSLEREAGKVPWIAPDSRCSSLSRDMSDFGRGPKSESLWASGKAVPGNERDPLVVSPLEKYRQKSRRDDVGKESLADSLNSGGRNQRVGSSLMAFSRDDLILLVFTVLFVVGLGFILQFLGVFPGERPPARRQVLGLYDIRLDLEIAREEGLI
jgi:serine/threonine protein kinase